MPCSSLIYRAPLETEALCAWMTAAQTACLLAGLALILGAWWRPRFAAAGVLLVVFAPFGAFIFVGYAAIYAAALCCLPVLKPESAV